ncbi:Hypothetical protein, putative [Bodo saltans]|uniref:Uncharacterized protein n=1 Tax=Bodo saltans TaxID=75058 RepID=A0A0S4J066_BODSA|nr:Hypothetical protein, putative [Bodo saltans]|eukprot:CUG40286.1 Hypothetical protein, putative [Bodo saltans]
MKCHEPCQCTANVNKRLPCGHTQQLLCTVSDLSTIHCSAVCGRKIVSCGHECSSECGGCAQLGEGFHTACKAAIKVWTPNGEQRGATCGDAMKPLDNVASPTVTSVTRLRELSADVFTLSDPCDKKLPCGCQCLGLLGELCPEFCIDHVPSDTSTLPKFMND